MAPKTVWCFYVVQNDAGDSADNPNAFRVRFAGETPTLADVRASFPLRHSGSFHFRFRLATKGGKDPKSYVHLDAVRDEDAVPRFGQHLIARVLRLGEYRHSPRLAVPTMGVDTQCKAFIIRKSRSPLHRARAMAVSSRGLLLVHAQTIAATAASVAAAAAASSADDAAAAPMSGSCTSAVSNQRPHFPLLPARTTAASRPVQTTSPPCHAAPWLSGGAPCPAQPSPPPAPALLPLPLQQHRPPHPHPPPLPMPPPSALRTHPPPPE